MEATQYNNNPQQCQGQSPPHPPVATAGTMSMGQIEVLNLLVQPMWIFDFVQEKNRWANTAGLAFWEAESMEEFCQRDRKQASSISSSTHKKLQQLQACIERGESQEFRWTLYPKGVARTVDITVTGVRLQEDHDDDHLCMLFHNVPVPTEKLAVQSLRGVEMLRHLPMAVCQFDMQGKAMFQNQWALLPEEEKITESEVGDKESVDRNENEDTNNDFVNRFIDPNVAREALKSIQTTAEEVLQFQAELRSTNEAGKSEFSEISLRRTTDPVTGKPVILYSAQDKSDAKNAQKHKADSVQKSEFLAIMAHEIRTPLHQVIGYVDLLEQTKPLNQEQMGYVKLLQSSTEGLMTVISDVLDYSKLEAGEMKIETIPYEPLSVVEGAMAAVRAGCDEKGLTLSIEQWGKDIPFRMLGDPNRVRQILLNILSNAVKFTHQGSICVSACTIPTPVDDDNHNNNNNEDRSINENSSTMNVATVTNDCETSHFSKWARISISDTGIGICPENQQMIFQKYQQENLAVARNYGGTGLGLSICQLLVHSMGGRIGVHSERGRGSEFYFMLPIKLPNQQPLPIGSMVEDLLGTKKMMEVGESLNILVAEDNRANQKLMGNMLNLLGHHPTIVANGKLAIDTIEEADRAGVYFDVVLMDIQMPVMDGLEATRRLRALGHKSLTIIGLTASVKQHDYRELGFDDWLAKPTPLKELQSKLRECREGQISSSPTQSSD